MYKNQLQELAQRSCFNLPSYACIREGPDHAPRFKATVNFNGEVFESPNYCSTLRQAEHSAAEVALNVLSTRGPARSLAARVLDETGVYKNLLQETTHRAGLSLPAYTTVRSGPGHLPVFTCTVDIAGIIFTGEPAKTKKQAEKNAAMAAWSALKHFAHSSGSSSFSAWDAEGSEEKEHEQEQEQITIARFLANLVGKDGESLGNHHLHYQQQQRRRILQSQRERNAKNTLIPIQGPRFHSQQQQQQQSRILTLPTLPPPPPAPAPTGSKLLPFIRSIFPQKAQQSQQHETVIPSPSQLPHPRVTSNAGTLATYSNKPTTPRVMQVQVKTRLGTPTPHEAPISLEEHQRDEDEWLNGASASSNRDNDSRSNNSSWNWANAITAFGSSNIFTPSYQMHTPQNFNFPSTLKSNSTVIQSNANTYGRSGSSSVCLRTPPSSLASPVRIRSTVPVCSAAPPRRMIIHDVSNDPNFVAPSHLSAAPAVCVRSVIPVCSAPTVPPGFSSLNHEAESSHRAQTDGNDEIDDQSDETRSRLLLSRLHL